MGTAPAFASASEAMEMVHAGLGCLAAADATALAGQEQARCLRMLEQADPGRPGRGRPDTSTG